MHAVGRQLAVQKVLDVRFHPRGHPQLVIGCNEAPNELLLFDLSSGSHRPLQGHACQIQAVECAMDDHAIIFPIALLPCGGIQAVEYAMDGDVILSCGGCTLKVWDSTSALLLHSCGPGVAATATATATASGNPSIACHRDKIRALAVNQKMSCGGDGGVALFDSRMHKAITRFSLGGSFEVRGIRGARGREVRGGDGGYREGWRLQHSVQHAGPTCSRFFVDYGDEGVNDARWLSASPGLVTASGNGRWDCSAMLACSATLACVAVWDLERDLTLADPLTAFSFNWLNDQSCILLTLQPFPCSSAVPSIPPSPQQCGSAAVALASPSLHGRWRGHPVTPALPFEASQKPFLCSSSPSLHDQVAVAPDDACIATEGDDQKVVSAFLSPLLLGPPSLSFDRLFNLDSLEAHTSPCLVALLQHVANGLRHQ
ncbi:unnamed protein product [Closterium sp. NIES-64]|nr:unnamed protein product [Closterium sp. NIES-64]